MATDIANCEGGAMDCSNIRFHVMVFDTALRTVAFCFSLVAAVLAIIDQNIPMFTITGTANWYYLSSTVFLVLANAIVCVYVSDSLKRLVIYYKKRVVPEMAVLMNTDLCMWVMLFCCANLVGHTVGVIGLNGYSIILSFLGSIVFLCLSVVALVSTTMST